MSTHLKTESNETSSDLLLYVNTVGTLSHTLWSVMISITHMLHACSLEYSTLCPWMTQQHPLPHTDTFTTVCFLARTYDGKLWGNARSRWHGHSDTHTFSDIFCLPSHAYSNTYPAHTTSSHWGWSPVLISAAISASGAFFSYVLTD